MVVVRPPLRNLSDRAIYCVSSACSGCVVAVPQSHVVRHHHAAHRVHQVFGLQVGELLLLLAQLDVEEVVVDLRNDRFSGTLRSPALAHHAGTMLRDS